MKNTPPPPSPVGQGAQQAKPHALARPAVSGHLSPLVGPTHVLWCVLRVVHYRTASGLGVRSHVDKRVAFGYPERAVRGVEARRNLTEVHPQVGRVQCVSSTLQVACSHRVGCATPVPDSRADCKHVVTDHVQWSQPLICRSFGGHLYGSELGSLLGINPWRWWPNSHAPLMGQYRRRPLVGVVGRVKVPRFIRRVEGQWSLPR